VRVSGPIRNDNPGKLYFGPTAADGQVQQMALSPDGSRLAAFTQSSGTITVYDVNTGRMMHHAKWFRGYVFAFGFSADGRRVFAWASDAIARVFDTETGLPAGPAVRTTVSRSELNDATRLRNCDISPDGQHIVAFYPSLPGVRMWDATGGDQLMTVPTPGISSQSVSLVRSRRISFQRHRRPEIGQRFDPTFRFPDSFVS